MHMHIPHEICMYRLSKTGEDHPADSREHGGRNGHRR